MMYETVRMMSICKIEYIRGDLGLIVCTVLKFEITINKIQLVYVRGWYMLGIIL